MAANPGAGTASEAVEEEAGSTEPLTRSALLRELSINDVLTTVYLVGLNLALFLAAPSPERTHNQWIFGGLLLLYALLLSAVRLGLLRRPAWLQAFVYRTAQLLAVLGSYLLFRDFLPVANPGSLDIELYQLDLALFGVEPALALDGYVTPAMTEWFAFFYYSYFILMCVHLFPIIYFSRDYRQVAEFGLGMTIIAAVGHTLYVLVPGFGPYLALTDQFENALPSGFWWNTVLTTVETGGALKDIFPSLHTGFTTFIVLFSFHHRKRLPYRYSLPIVAFFVVNIIGATMYLRWHYLIDVVAGLLLATAAYVLAVRGTAWEADRRKRVGRSPVWPAWN